MAIVMLRRSKGYERKDDSDYIDDTMWSNSHPTIQIMMREQRKRYTLSKREKVAVNTSHFLH
jgi:hypothetical protein